MTFSRRQLFKLAGSGLLVAAATPLISVSEALGEPEGVLMPVGRYNQETGTYPLGSLRVASISVTADMIDVTHFHDTWKWYEYPSMMEVEVVLRGPYDQATRDAIRLFDGMGWSR